jgi:hypothetical protein
MERKTYMFIEAALQTQPIFSERQDTISHTVLAQVVRKLREGWKGGRQIGKQICST